jgi:hypothetical protein
MWNKISNYLALAVMVTFLSSSFGCTKTVKHFAIRNADWFLMYLMDDYFDLTSEQYDRWDPESRVHLRWIQADVLPNALVELKNINAIETPFTEAQIKKIFFVDPMKYWLIVADKLSVDGGELFGNLSEEQYKHLEEKTLKKVENWTELAESSPEDYAEDYRDLQVERLDTLEEWIGEVSEKQYEKIYQITFVDQERYKLETQIMITVRTEFLKKIREVKNNTERVKFLKAWAREPTISNLKLYREYRQWRRARQLKFWVELEKILTPKQRQARRNKINELIADLEYIQNTKYIK